MSPFGPFRRLPWSSDTSAVGGHADIRATSIRGDWTHKRYCVTELSVAWFALFVIRRLICSARFRPISSTKMIHAEASATIWTPTTLSTRSHDELETVTAVIVRASVGICRHAWRDHVLIRPRAPRNVRYGPINLGGSFGFFLLSMVHPYNVLLWIYRCIGSLLSLRDRQQRRRKGRCYRGNGYFTKRGYLLRHGILPDAAPWFLLLCPTPRLKADKIEFLVQFRATQWRVQSQLLVDAMQNAARPDRQRSIASPWRYDVELQPLCYDHPEQQ